MSDEVESLGSARALRRSIRTLVAMHARANPDSFIAHMTASALFWLLGGRSGLDVKQRRELVSKAHMFLDNALETFPEDAILVKAHQDLMDLATLVEVEVIHATENVAKEGDPSPAEFIAMMENAWNAPSEDPPAEPEADTGT